MQTMGQEGKLDGEGWIDGHGKQLWVVILVWWKFESGGLITVVYSELQNGDNLTYETHNNVFRK